MRRLREWIQVDAVVDDGNGSNDRVPHDELAVDNMVATWGGVAYAELSVILVHLRYLALLHQTHHWTARGDAFYGDHKLFEDLYNNVVSEIDAVGERAVGLGCEANVHLPLQISQVMRLCADSGSPQTVPQSSDLARASLVAEMRFLKVLRGSLNSMRDNHTVTDGAENLLQQISDTHEKHIYLLKRRASCAPMGF